MKAFGQLGRLLSYGKATKSVEEDIIPTINEAKFDEEEEGEEDEVLVEIDENERWNDSGWSFMNLRNDDPQRFVSSAGQSSTFPDPPLSDGWVYDGHWTIDKSLDNCDGDGWISSFSFQELDECGGSKISSGSQMYVRRKKWIRKVRPLVISPIPSNCPQTNYQEFGEVNDHESEIGSECSDDNVQSTVKIEVDSDSDDENRGNSRVKSNSNNGNSSKTAQKVSSFFSFGSTPDIPASDPVMRVRDSSLIAIGKQLKSLESLSQLKNDDEAKDWQKCHKPVLVTQMAELQKQCQEIQAKIETELYKGLEAVNHLEIELNRYTERLEDIKKKFYFPTSAITVGQGGVYAGLDDVWLEQASGHFVLDMIPSKDSPQVNLVFTGTNNAMDSGISVRLQMEGFKLAGDKGKRIPKLAFESIKVTLTLRVSIIMNFDITTSTWRTSPKNFNLDLLSFKGPYGARKSMVSATLALLTPMIRSKLLSAMPQELGFLIKSFPTPFSMRGEFDVTGPEISILTSLMQTTPVICNLCGYSFYQMEMFEYLQKSMERSKPIRTMSELLAYYRTHQRHSGEWATIVTLWNQAAKIYSEKVAAVKTQTDAGEHNPLKYALSFSPLLAAVQEVLRKRVCVQFKLEHVDGQVSLNSLLIHLSQFFQRIATEESAKSVGVKQARLLVMLGRMQASNQLGQEVIHALARNIDFVQLKIAAGVHSGPHGSLEMIVSELMAQAPLMVQLNMSKQKSIGQQSIVPYTISFKPHVSGNVAIEVHHRCHEPTEDHEEMGVHPDTRHHSKERYSVSSASIIGKADPGHLQHLSEALHAVTSHSHSIAAAVAAPITWWADRRLREHETTHSSTNLHTTTTQDKDTFGVSDAPEDPSVKSRIIRVLADKPHISIIVDKSVSYKPGAELFSIAVGEMGSKVQCQCQACMMGDLSSHQYLQTDTPNHAENETFEHGCPLTIQSAAGIKLLAQIPRAEVCVNLEALVAFASAHFNDLTVLKIFLERLSGSDFFEEQLQVGKTVLDRIAKYLLLPGLNLDLNINGKLVSRENDVLIRIETPDFEAMSSEGDSRNRDSARAELAEEGHVSAILSQQLQAGTQSINRAISAATDIIAISAATAVDKSCAIRFKAEFNLMDIVEDSLAVEQSLKSAFDKK